MKNKIGIYRMPQRNNRVVLVGEFEIETQKDLADFKKRFNATCDEFERALIDGYDLAKEKKRLEELFMFEAKGEFGYLTWNFREKHSTYKSDMTALNSLIGEGKAKLHSSTNKTKTFVFSPKGFKK